MLRARGRQSARHLLGTASSAKLAELADREVQILELVGAGRTSVAIARARRQPAHDRQAP
jgi:DNA-binding CsgD family transcriptional regulator